MRNKKTLVVSGIIIIFALIVYSLYQEDIADNGKAYKSKQTLCRQFAQSYLRTINKTENVGSENDPERWQMAVDVETDLYRMCLLDLNKESLKNYKINALEKYQK